jgi:predicted SnoaL-like aldol condensation-catalyzing enzyme
MRTVAIRLIAAATAALLASTPAHAQETLTMSVPPVVSQDHAALLASDDPRLAANKQLVYDMYRIVLQGGHWDRAHEFIAVDYIQHNPNAAQGLQGLIDYVRASRPVREIKDALDLPLIHLMAEGDYVSTSFVRPEQDANGETYYSTWFDLYRIEDGKIAEHWDPMLKSDPKIDPNDKRI